MREKMPGPDRGRRQDQVPGPQDQHPLPRHQPRPVPPLRRLRGDGHLRPAARPHGEQPDLAGPERARRPGSRPARARSADAGRGAGARASRLRGRGPGEPRGSTVPTKAATVNPQKNSPALGATLAYLGVDGMLGLLHGAQGCSTFIRLQLSRHFKESIALNSTAMSEDTAIFGGWDNLKAGIEAGDREVPARGGGRHDLRAHRDHGRRRAERHRPASAPSTPSWPARRWSGPPPPTTAGRCRRGTRRRSRRSSPPWPRGAQDRAAGEPPPRRAPHAGRRGGAEGARRGLRPHRHRHPRHLHRPRRPHGRRGVVRSPPAGSRSRPCAAPAAARPRSTWATRWRGRRAPWRSGTACPAYGFTSVTGLEATDRLVSALAALSGRTAPEGAAPLAEPPPRRHGRQPLPVRAASKVALALEADALKGLTRFLAGMGCEVQAALSATPHPRARRRCPAANVLVGDLEDLESGGGRRRPAGGELQRPPDRGAA